MDIRALDFAKMHPVMGTIDGIKYYMLEQIHTNLWEGFAPRYFINLLRYDLLSGKYVPRPFGLTDCKIVNKETL